MNTGNKDFFAVNILTWWPSVTSACIEISGNFVVILRLEDFAVQSLDLLNNILGVILTFWWTETANIA